MSFRHRLLSSSVLLWRFANQGQDNNGGTKFVEVAKTSVWAVPAHVTSEGISGLSEYLSSPLSDGVCASVEETTALAATREVLPRRFMSEDIRFAEVTMATEKQT